ncbi:ribosomal protection-like ABC-F family protein [Brassicibacter mesophilus]|uniref:ribosomal protection-like ABC-F family protein n=1 Tax=Brassicibacter mesophilus TaxID=745119 RepID=UPI003D1A29F2
MLLNVNNITKYINEKEILKDISFKLYKGYKVGLVGQNGIGKTTLFRTIVGELKPNNGNVTIYGKFGYLPQHISFNKDIKVYDFIKSVDNYAEVLKILSKFDLKNIEDRNISTLSGGEKTKLYLVKLILEEPDMLILDEPTNHLDYDSIVWLESFINSFNGAVLMITHDRYFLDNTVAKIFELENKTINEYNGNYSFYAEKKKLEYEKAMQEYEEYIKEKKKLEIAARSHMNRANKYNDMSQNDFQRGKSAKIAKRSKAIISRIEKMDKKEKPLEIKKISMKFDDNNTKINETLIRAENLSKSFDKPLFNNISFNVCRHKRVAIVGKNGIGKSTLLKGLVGREQLSGNLYISPSTRIGYFSQELENLNTEATILEEIKEINKDESFVRTLLGCMLFKSDDVYKQIKVLSLGERVRVIFLKLILQDNNLLVLDEPTNFLDIPTREIIEDALINYNGAILLVSHDRYFIKKMAEEIWEISSNSLYQYLGGYEYYLSKKARPVRAEFTDRKEEILSLEMTLSHISFKMLNCNESEKKELEKEYFDIAKKIKALKNA